MKNSKEKYLVLFKTLSEGIVVPPWGIEFINGFEDLETEVSNILNEMELHDNENEESEFSENKIDDVIILRVDNSFKFKIEKIEKTITIFAAKINTKASIVPAQFLQPLSLVRDEDDGE